jgi:hypothetical protein
VMDVYHRHTQYGPCKCCRPGCFPCQASLKEFTIRNISLRKEAVSRQPTPNAILFSLLCNFIFPSAVTRKRRSLSRRIAFRKTVTALRLNLQNKKHTTMRYTFLLLFLTTGFFARSQSLKDALFSGKLKNQPGTVIRKGDDLASKMDTAYKVPAADTAKAGTLSPVVTTETASGLPAAQTNRDTVSVVAPENNSQNQPNAPEQGATDATETSDAAASAEVPKETPVKPKDNNAIWKEYAKTLTETLKTEVLPSKKVKKGDYYILVSYAIETDGKVTVTDVFVDPGNEFLQQQIKERLSLEAPQLSPVLNSAGTPRKVNKKYNFTLTKE